MGNSAAALREKNLADLHRIAELNQQLMRAVQSLPVDKLDPELHRLVQASADALQTAYQHSNRLGLI